MCRHGLNSYGQLSTKAVETLRFASGDAALREECYERLGEALFDDFPSIRSSLEKLLNNWASGKAASEDETATKKTLPEKKRKKLLDPKTWERDANLAKVAAALRKDLGDSVFEDHNVFREQVDAALARGGIKIGAADKKVLLRAVSWRAENAPPVIKKVHRLSKASADPLRGLFEATVSGKPCVVEYEHDSELRDAEQVPLMEAGGIEAFIRREVLPYAPDAWIDQASIKKGYEIGFTRHFYKPEPLRPLDEIKADIQALEKETEGLLVEIIGSER
jgi:type I restriction enzyme M protein